ncbi:DMT family transporter [Photobacterium halotolerans]|uniref:DMT family transporter n=1 Tax=Photobacterium halotolerans TaxID=265726 RepID=UPI0013724688|nr:EamA family transporter [Photobacterium halotolerans]NAW86129.1 EamA family transporter [Photobacterium halotolerans]NAX47419.1 EamA family transporter [Photobacterium halotolerans]
MNYLLALLVPMLWGSTYAAVSLFLQDMSPYWVAVWRALPAGLVLLLIRPKLPPLSWSRMTLLSFCNIAAFFVLLFIAAYRLPGSVAGTLGATMPLQMMLLQWLGEGKKPDPRSVALAVLGLIGVGLLLNPSADLDPIGTLAALAGTALVSQSAIWMKRWPVNDALSFAAWQLVLGGMMLIPFAWFVAGAPVALSVDAIPGLLWLVLLNTAFGYWAWVRSVKKLGPNVMSMFSLMNPVTAVLLGIGLVGESLGLLQWTGIGLILMALLLMKKPAKPTRTDVSAPDGQQEKPGPEKVSHQQSHPSVSVRH